MNYKIAIINLVNLEDYMGNTILDGMLLLKKEYPQLKFFVSSDSNRLLPKNYVLPRYEFLDFAKKADLIFFIHSVRNTDFELAKEIGLWEKTVFIDGTEVKKNNRHDPSIQKSLLSGEYKGDGAIVSEMLTLCPLYFRREKPYINGIIPLPFGVESKYTKSYNHNIEKDIDFVCIFGQDEYPPMRKHTRDLLVKYCEKNNFTYWVTKTRRQDEFYQLLARSKAGVSIGGGGFDTMRFWEILGNNCLLLTEKIDIFKDPTNEELNYKRIWQFSNLHDFEGQLAQVGNFLRTAYKQEDLEEEYQQILADHSTKARVLTILSEAKTKKLIR